MNPQPRVRFAPSPTGPLHIGGLRTALYNYLYAKKLGGSFILRIEDTDQTRLVPGSEQYIMRALEWCGLTPDEGAELGGGFGPYRQSERSELYRTHIHQLVQSGRAYYAFDTPDELNAMREREIQKGNRGPKYDIHTRSAMRNSLSLGSTTAQQMIDAGEPYTVRMLVPDDRQVHFHDQVRGEISFRTNELDDKIILKTDGLPTYHLANVVDDHLMEITHVIRGEEWLPSTAHHVLLYEAFGWEMPQFAHLPLILKPSGKGKLSKRDGQKFGFPVFPLAWHQPEEAFDGFDSYGFNPQAVINFLAFLGWNPGTEQEIFSMQELIQTFSLDHISKAGARFDYDKACWYNAQYIQQEDDSVLAGHVMPFLHQAGYETTAQYLQKVVHLLKPRLQTYRSFPEQGYYFFEEVKDFNKKVLRKKWKEPHISHIRTLQRLLHQIPEETFTTDHLRSTVSGYIKEQELSFGDILPLLRVALSGDTKGPDLFEMMEVMERDKVMQRLQNSLGHFDSIID